MQKIPKIFFVLGIVVGVLLLGGVIGILAGRSAAKSRAAIVQPAASETTPTQSNQLAPAIGQPSATVPATSPDFNVGETMPPAPAFTGILTNWEEKVDEILGAETDDTNKVRQLFALFPHVPNESKSEVAQHLSNLTSDADYVQLSDFLKDPALGGDALDVLLADALNRPNSLKLPALLEVAQTPNHPKADEAKDILDLFLDKNLNEEFGTDWIKWQGAVTAWLKDNPD